MTRSHHETILSADESLDAQSIIDKFDLDYSERTVQRWRNRPFGEGKYEDGPPEGAPVVVPEQKTRKVRMRQSDFDALGARTRVSYRKPPPAYDPITIGRRVFDELEAESDGYLTNKRENPPDLVHVDVETDTPIALANLSDIHIGHKGTDHKRAREDAQLLADTPGAFAIFGGDGIDNFIKHHSAMVNKGSEPESEYCALEYYLSLFGDSLLGGITGNHDFWSKNLSGVDYLRQLMRRLGIYYAKHRLRLVLTVNDTPYRIELRHNYRYKSSINPTNQFNRMWEKSDWEWDIGLVGHTHDGPWCAPFVRHGKERWGGQAGCYKVDDSYSQQWGYNDSQPSTPVFILGHEGYDVTGVNDLRKGLAMLEAVRAA